jgi:hypothetical protein
LYAESGKFTVSGLSNPVVLLETGTAFACATLMNQSTYCWGNYKLGQHTASMVQPWTIDQIPELNKATTIAFGGGHGCAVLESTDVVCWGQLVTSDTGLATCPDIGRENGYIAAIPELKLNTPERPLLWDHLWGAQASGTSESRIPMGGAIVHPLALTSEPVWHWVNVEMTVACMTHGASECVIMLARNLRNQSSEADEFFGGYTLSNGQSLEISTVVWVRDGDTIAVSVPNVDGDVTVTSVFAFEDSESCAYTCPQSDYMRNGECVRCVNVCAFDMYPSDCTTHTLFPFSECMQCDTKPVDNNLTIYEFKEGDVCNWRCVDEYFWNGTACLLARTEPCAVGEYLDPYMWDRDSVCRQCFPSRQDPFRVFVTDGGGRSTQCREECINGRYYTGDRSCQQCDTTRCGIGGGRETMQFSTTVPCAIAEQSYCVACTSNNQDIVMTASGDGICAYSCNAGLYPNPICGEWDEHFHEKTIVINTTTSVTSSTDVYLPNEHEAATETPLTFQPNSVFRLTGKISVVARTRNSMVRAWVHGSDNPLAEFTPRVSASNGGGVSVWETVSLDWVGLLVVSTFNNPADFYALRFEAIDTDMNLADLSLSAQTHTSCSNESYTCTECDTVSLPHHARFIVSKQCEWVCDESYEIRLYDDIEECIYCPILSCEIGEYMSDCGVCSACVKNDVNAIFSSHGIRDKASSCTTRCAYTAFKSIDTGNCTECSSFTPEVGHEVCEFQSYFVECTTTSDAHCAPCTPCPLGMYAGTACSSSGDAVCIPCTANFSATGSLPEHGYWLSQVTDETNGDVIYLESCSWRCDAPYIHDEHQGVCKTCTHDCGIGYYESDCTRDTTWRGCMPCIVPENANASDHGRQTVNSCPWFCSDGFVKDDDGSGCVPQPNAPVVVVAPTPCALTSYDCEAGGYLSTASVCSCEPCSPPANASTGIARFIARGSCEWVCIHPYIRVHDICTSVKDMRMQSGGTLTASGGTVGVAIHPFVIVGSMLPFFFILTIVCVLVMR